MPNIQSGQTNKNPEFHTHALPKETFDYLCTILPRGWIILYTYPINNSANGDVEDASKEGMVISTAIKPGSILVPIANHLHNITSS